MAAAVSASFTAFSTTESTFPTGCSTIRSSGRFNTSLIRLADADAFEYITKIRDKNKIEFKIIVTYDINAMMTPGVVNPSLTRFAPTKRTSTNPIFKMMLMTGFIAPMIIPAC